VYKTADGGLTWGRILFFDDDTGPTELMMDPSNNKVLYAATYQGMRATWGFNGGGPGSAIYKSTDAGRTWTRLTKGIPEGPLGRMGLHLYRKDPNIVYARIEHQRESGDLEKAVGEANAFLAGLPALYKALADQNLYPAAPPALKQPGSRPQAVSVATFLRRREIAS
jgi:hypothetical protein